MQTLTSPPNIQRLAALAKLLSSPLPSAVTFDLGLYHNTGSCGTVCCALGLAATNPDFQAQGFTLTKSGFPLYQNSRGIEAAALFFSLPLEKVRHLFWSFSYQQSGSPTQQQVARRIKQFIKAATPTNGAPA